METRTSRRGTAHWAAATTASLWVAHAVQSVAGQSIPARWGQAGLLLSPSSTPHFLVTSGKSYAAGQTESSTPSISSPAASFLSLDLSQPILDLSSPPWLAPTQLDGANRASEPPIASWGNFVAINETTAVYFGGDATGDPTVPVQTRNDSSRVVSLAYGDPASPRSSALTASWGAETTGWADQPERREMSFATSASNGVVTRSWLFGGVRADGSGLGFDELWEMQVSLEDGSVEWALATLGGEAGPGAVYDGTAVLVPSTGRGSQPTIYLVGGVSSSSNSLVPMYTIYSFTPSSTIGSGTWSNVRVDGGPSPRRGHSAVYLGDDKVWVSGGRDLDGATVYSDSWVLDLGAGSGSVARWTRVSDADEASWGKSAVLLGETVVSSFGYGTNSPASTGLKIYAFGNDTWLDAYYPSYITAIPTNPKASPSESSRLPSSSSTTGSNSPSNPKAHQPDSSSSTSSSSSESSSGSNPDDSGSSSSPSGGNGSSWTSPGTPHSPTSDSNSSSSDGKDSAAGPSKSLVAGAVVGSLLGALAIAAIGVYGMRKRRRTSASDGQDRYGGGFMKGGRRLTGDEYGNYEEEYMGMVEKPRGGAAAGAGTSGGGMSALFSTAPARSASTGAANGVLPLKKRRRFDMLRDEEEDDEEDRHEPNAGGVEKGWARFDEEDEADDHRTRNRIASDVSDESTRIGVGIWGGMGLARSESVKSGTSYLGTNLGGFLRSDSTMSHEYGGVPGGVETVGDTSLTPIAEWEEDDDDEDDGTTESGYYALGGGGIGSRSTEMHNARSAESHQTRSTQSHTVQSHEEASIKTATRIVRPFSPGSTSSLYGSGFATPVPFTVQPGGGGGGITRSASASSSLFLSPIRRDNSSSWWSRLKQHQPSELPSSTAFEAIRDPAPAPSLDAQARAIVDPFSDHAQVPGSVERSNSLNEHGMMASRSVRGIHDRSISSNVSEVTATSSILEERMRGMDVVQRIRTGEGSDGSGSIGTGGGNSNQTTPELSQNPFSDPAPPLGSQTPGSVIFAGSQAAFSPRAGATTPPPVPAIPPFPLLPVILPPTPTRSAQSPPQSPRKARLMGPRPQPSQALPSIARSGSVKDLVREIERRNSLPLSTSPGVCSPFASPTKASRSKTTRVATGAPTSKVEHGLVKKPILYVANP